MTTPVTEKMCKIRHDNLDNKVSDIKDEVTKIRILFSGNGQLGITVKVNHMWEDYQAKKKSTQGWVDWGFRILILALMGWIGVK